MKKSASKIYTAIIYAFLFAPIIILLIFSFNEGKSLSVFTGFSLKWYKELLNDANTLEALKNSLVLAFSATVISVVLGTMASVGINKLRSRWYRTTIDTVTNIPMTNPDIITGISLMLMFVFVGRLFGASTSLNFVTMLIAHVTFCLPYVILQVLPKLQQMDKALAEAAMDLGCPPLRAFFKVELPEIMPGIITGAIMAFTMSLDDFVISYFTSGNGFQTLPIRIYGMTKKTVTPKMYALATIIFFVTLTLLLVNNIVDNEDSRKLAQARKVQKGEKPEDDYNPTKRNAALVIAGVLVIVLCVGAFGGSTGAKELNVYNWGEYISDGSEGSFDTIKEFEKWYEETYGEKIVVNYDTFASNEDMYNKISSGAVSYDIIIPSDYMVARMAKENMLLPLNFENIPNYQYISDQFHGLYYDPDNMYTVPYTYGIVGVIYDANVVDSSDIGGWDLLWNDKYADKIVQFNNSRDAFGTAMYKLGIDVNTTDTVLWDKAHEELMTQRQLIYSFVMDEIFNIMQAGEASIGSYYAGDYFTMMEDQADNVDLQFYYPEHTNMFIDAMCIPSCAQNKELAEIFINYMLSEEAAVANAEYTYYASPNSLVYENEIYIEDMGEDVVEILYPQYENFADEYNKYAYRTLDQTMLDYMNKLWETVKVN
ncbi:MAG: extracellular solute-binding protein [Oscillospiraceae bacterium]|nr:extracellular solute-binding protein [Oscillospiraceae bacterium]